MTRIIKFCGFLVALSAILAAGLVWYLKCSTLPQTQGEIHLNGLHGPVSIYRDSNGIPHINATTDEDAYFALGFVHAQDRFWQMEFQRRVASGTLSEIFGKATIDNDKYLRAWGFYHAAETAWPAFNDRTKSLIQSYTDGVNAFMAQNRFPLEIRILHYQPKPWTVIDSIAWEKMMAWTLQSHSWLNKINYTLATKYLGKDKLAKYYPENSQVPSTLLYAMSNQAQQIEHQIGFNDAEGKGSNAWVIAGSHTTTGKPLLANDVHLALTAPGLWYLVELRGATIHVTGATLPGLPGIVIGHNDYIAWGVTSGYNDAAELYELNDTIPLTKRVEKIHVKHEDDIDLPVYSSAYGPVISDVTPQLKSSPHRIAVAWTALQPNDTTAQSFLELNEAKDWNEFTTSLKDFITPTQNFMFADKAGNIGFYYPGKLPIRHWKDLSILPADQKYLWQEYIPFDELPHVLNPTMGYIASANNRPVGNEYKYSLNDRWPVPPYRIERIRELLQSKSKLSVSDMGNIQADVLSEFWLDLRSELLATKTGDAGSQQALRVLAAWNGEMKGKLAAPAIFAYWVQALSELTPAVLQNKDKIIEPLYLKQKLSEPGSAAVLSDTLKVAIQNLAASQGNDITQWRWDHAHQANFVLNGLGKVKPLGWIWNRHIPTSGGAFTVDVGGYDPATFKQIQGPSFRQIIDMSDLDNSLYMAPIGQSGNPFSEHYDDWMAKWKNVQYVKIPSANACERGSDGCLTMLPAVTG